VTKKVLYFIAGDVPTTSELADIAYLDSRALPVYAVGVRNAAKQTAFTSPESPDTASLESADYAASASAGANIPAAYSGVPVLSIPQGGTGLQLVIGPAALSFAHTALSQMSAFTIDANGNVTDVTADAGMVWSSGTTGHMTVGAGTGVLTGVAAGTSVITATLTKSGHTVVATETVTAT
jgi:hypothetical protein